MQLRLLCSKALYQEKLSLHQESTQTFHKTTNSESQINEYKVRPSKRFLAPSPSYPFCKWLIYTWKSPIWMCFFHILSPDLRNLNYLAYNFPQCTLMLITSFLFKCPFLFSPNLTRIFFKCVFFNIKYKYIFWYINNLL